MSGYLTSGAYSHTLGAAVGLGYAPCAPSDTPQDVLARRYEIEVAGERIAATASLQPLYDPTGARIRV